MTPNHNHAPRHLWLNDNIDASPAAAGVLRHVAAITLTEKTPCPDAAVIHIIEDNPALREAQRLVFEAVGWQVCDHSSAEKFLAAPRPSGDVCLIVDVMLPGMNGVAMLELLQAEIRCMPAIVLTGRDDAATAVAALKAGASDFIEKPADPVELLLAVRLALTEARDCRAREHARAVATARFAAITPREHEVMLMVLDGLPNKIIADRLSINQRTVENHRAAVMQKTGSSSLPALVKAFLAATEEP